VHRVRSFLPGVPCRASCRVAFASDRAAEYGLTDD